jgi:hypothetical protein
MVVVGMLSSVVDSPVENLEKNTFILKILVWLDVVEVFLIDVFRDHHLWIDVVIFKIWAKELPLFAQTTY